jgi:hypothetical protein
MGSRGSLFVNAEPGWFDLQESVRRTIHWIDEAGKAGCKLIAIEMLIIFPRVFALKIVV